MSLLLISTLSVISVNASDATPTGIHYYGDPITIPEGDFASYERDNNGDYYIHYDLNNPDFFGYSYMRLEVEYTSQTRYFIYDGGWKDEENGEPVPDIIITDNQAEKHWSKALGGSIPLSYAGISTELPVNITDNGLSEPELTGYNSVTLDGRNTVINRVSVSDGRIYQEFDAEYAFNQLIGPGTVFSILRSGVKYSGSYNAGEKEFVLSGIKGDKISVKPQFIIRQSASEPVKNGKINAVLYVTGTTLDIPLTVINSENDVTASEPEIIGGATKIAEEVQVDPVKLKKLTPGRKRFTVKWQRDITVSGYEIQYSLKKGFPKKSRRTVTVKGGKSNRLIVKKLKTNKKYFVRIRAFETVNGVKHFSKWSAAKSVKTK